jgi:hypothetical protein
MPKSFWYLSTVLLILSCYSRVSCAQMTQHNRTLVINGQAGDAAVVESNGRTFVDLETLVRVTNGSLQFQGTQIIVTLPISGGNGPTAPSGPDHQATPGLSQEFMKAGIEATALLREWASPLANAMRNGYPITEDWVSSYREKAANGLRLASVAASAGPDQNALQLLTNEFEAVKEWSNKLIEARQSMDAKYSMSDKALQDDPLSQKIVSCARFLESMLESRSFQDETSCH